MNIREGEYGIFFDINFDSLSVFFSIYFLLHEIFAMSISYFYTVVSSGVITQIIVFSYQLRNISFIFGMIFIIVKEKLTAESILVPLALLIAYVYTYIFYPGNVKYAKDISPYLILCAQSYIIAYTSPFKWQTLRDWSVWIARILVVCVSLGLINVPHQAKYLDIHYMTFANAMLVPTALVIYSLYDSKGVWRIIDIGLALIGSLMMLLYGTRGGFLILGLFSFIIIFMKVDKNKIILLGVIIFLMLLLLFGPISSGNMGTGLVGNHQSRNIEKMLSGDMFTSNRTHLYSYLFQKIVDDGFLGHGLCADRYYLPFQFASTDANYAHNFYIEMLVDFGLLGFAVSIYVTISIYKNCIKIKKNSYKAFMLCFVFVSFLQLMISRSWLVEANFFILLGLIASHKNGDENDEKSISSDSNLSQR